MAEYISIKRPNNSITIVRSKIETASENELTEHEQIINQLYNENKKLKGSARQFDEIAAKMEEFFEKDDKDWDLCTVGEYLCGYFGIYD